MLDRRIYVLVLLAAQPTLIAAYSTGYVGGCTATPGHGAFAVDTPPFVLTAFDSPLSTTTTYTAGGGPLTLQIEGSGALEFKGFGLRAVAGPSFSSATIGALAGDEDCACAQAVTGCGGMLTHTNAGSKAVVRAQWTPPAAAGSNMTLVWAVVVVNSSLNYELKLERESSLVLLLSLS